MASIARKFISNFLCLLLFLGLSSSQQPNTLVQRQELKDGDELVSANGKFRLGFFNLTSNNSYLGIWYDGDSLTNVVWVANPNAPLFGNSVSLIIDDYGSLKISYSKMGPSIPLNTGQEASNCSAVLLDTGNFVLHELNSDGTVKRDLWQSFDYPTDTLLPGMKLGFNRKSEQAWSLKSWRSDVVPDTGSFTFGMNKDSKPGNEFDVMWREDKYWTGGFSQEEGYQHKPINGFTLQDQRGSFYAFSKISNENETYFSYSANEDIKTFPRLRIDYLGKLYLGERLLVQCNTSSPASNEGCVKQELPECRSPDITFAERSGYFVDTDGFEFHADDNLTHMDCQDKCLKVCSCVAFAPSMTDGTGCKIWTTVPNFQMSENASKVYFLVYKAKLSVNAAKPNRWWIWLIVAVGGVIIILFFSLCYAKINKKRVAEGERKRKQNMLIQELGGNAIPSTVHDNVNNQNKDGQTSHELHVFSFESITIATSNFSTENKLGEGGFGPVYKGKLPDGREIAIKRLSKSSGQGLLEFKNEVILIAKLQHTNLVRLLGFCIQEEENMLIYEYMPNKSLDIFLFDPTKKYILNWKTRFNIIEGIAQGLVYLHKYSRLRIVHRDLKASNILLDEEMNPKISDFGLARIFGLKESEENTNRVVGTYGYMSPEYAMNGVVSIKTDVFSFGVLLLEIVSGKKNNSRYHSDHPLNLIEYAWKLWNEGKDLELIDPTILDDSCSLYEVSRCIHVGLLCVQDQATDRPTMLNVVSMLSNETLQLSPPKQPVFFINTFVEEIPVSEIKPGSCSVNNVTVSVMKPR
ncbi:G-type lectin S-receptor-like serine/threonine-protein kinase CES101 [Quercus suber]|uniref:G-type lectin S-receptor-like serine/threonine-protein kinase CES101 n=1 Tax=Quercus suber TaxID=58331 RepID=UPI000CE1B42E|nr:G-type lectin S-receptor-like serine/threonine-protein kinase CES101 [Quercus suber]